VRIFLNSFSLTHQMAWEGLWAHGSIEECLVAGHWSDQGAQHQGNGWTPSPLYYNVCFTSLNVFHFIWFKFTYTLVPFTSFYSSSHPFYPLHFIQVHIHFSSHSLHLIQFTLSLVHTHTHFLLFKFTFILDHTHFLLFKFIHFIQIHFLIFKFN